ncbi:DUF87 domain-containing protein [Leptolyngbya sp. FACHB-321]|uniref:helicase HerA domain-containing protein n=1 Tax=Leptolyngbya sp. FACHB-321 TaxID=2692807 RepID=UPI001684308F|nr:DUF87 domain-containing protein [Leptolyngbya sp. FACHB-321]MBD2033537.1 DUF87 domain-containing protein [Leptolyngbya sp. FACHB-321]
MKTQKRLGKQKVTAPTGGKAVSLTAMEDSLDLQFPLHYNLRGRSTGALVLGKGQAKDRLKFVFGFECKGIHSTLRDSQIETAFDKLESGLKDLPPGETLTIHFGSFSSDASRQRRLTEIAAGASSDALKFLLYSEKQRIQELTQTGMRKPKFLKLYVTYTIDPNTHGATDPIERLTKRGLSWWNKFTGQLEEVEQVRFEDLFTKAFTDGFQIWEQLLGNKLGLDVRPMDETMLWKNLWSRLNQTDAPPLPQVVTMSEQGLSEVVRSDIHPTTLLLESQETMPVADRAWAHVNGKFVGALTFVDKPAGWASKDDQLRYLWDLLSRDNVTDTEVFCQLQRANEALVKTNMQRLTKQSIVSSNLATSKNSVDVAALSKVRKAVAAQEQLYEGSVPLHTAVVILVHRDSLDDLDEGCRYLQSCVRRPAWIDRELEYAWLIWQQTLPVCWDSMLIRPFNRRLCYLTGEAPGFMSLVLPQAADEDGFELISDEGGVPLYIDLFNQHRHLAVFGTTRSGKSVMISGWLTQALSRKIPIVVLDFPTDGASTFKDYAAFLGPETGAYFDIGTERNNLFEIPDLRSLSMEQAQNRMQDYIAFLESALMTMILGGDSTTPEMLVLKRTIRAQINLLLGKFFNDPGIDRRYLDAMNAGVGTALWKQMPTMRDFLGICTLDNVGSGVADDPDIRRAMGFIKLQLEFWLNSRVGRAISEPSTFRTDAPLLVFALRNLTEDDDAAILALSAYSAALRRALSSPESIFFIDESPILFEFDQISELVARLCANGAKAGVRVILSAQDVDTIAQSPSASKILQNLSTRLVGRIQPNAVASFVKYLNYDESIIARNATASFFPKREGIYSQWLLDNNVTFTFCRYYSPYFQLGIVANNPHEQRARDAFAAAYSDRFTAVAKFATELCASLRDGRKMRLPKPRTAIAAAPTTLKVAPEIAVAPVAVNVPPEAVVEAPGSQAVVVTTLVSESSLSLEATEPEVEVEAAQEEQLVALEPTWSVITAPPFNGNAVTFIPSVTPSDSNASVPEPVPDLTSVGSAV